MAGDSKRKIKVGDEFDIPVRVVEIRPNCAQKFKVEVRGHPDLTDWVCGATLEASRLVREAPEPLKVGDRVRSNSTQFGFGEEQRILSINRDMVWLRSSTGRYTTTTLAGLERAD